MRAKRWVLTMLALAPIVATSCTVKVGCTAYKFFETGLTKPYVVDKSACVTTPPAVVSEVPYALLLPFAAAVVIAGAFLLMKRRRISASSI
jgi:hypothetical protein